MEQEAVAGGYLWWKLFNNRRSPQSERNPELINSQDCHHLNPAQVCLSNARANLLSSESTDFQSRQSKQPHLRDPTNPEQQVKG